MNLFLILRILIRRQSKNLCILNNFSDIARIRIFKNGALINEVKEQGMNLGMQNQNNVAPNNSIIRINPSSNMNNNIEILKNQEEINDEIFNNENNF